MAFPQWVNPMFIDDNDQEINMKDVDLDKDLARCPTMRERSNSSGYGSSNHSEGIYNDDFKDSPVHSNNATLSGPPIKKPDQITTSPSFPTISRSQSRWTETFRSDSEYYHQIPLREPQFSDSTADNISSSNGEEAETCDNQENIKSLDERSPGSPKPRPRLSLPQSRVLGSLENTTNVLNNKENVFIISKDLEHREPILRTSQPVYLARNSRISEYQNYPIYENPIGKPECYQRDGGFRQNPELLLRNQRFLNQISKPLQVNRDNPQNFTPRNRDLYPGGRYRRESRASSLSSGSVTSSSGQGTLSTIPEGKLLTEDYQCFGDVLSRKNNLESASVAENSECDSKDNFEVLKHTSEVQNGHHQGFAIPRPVWPPMDRIILARRKYDGWDSDSNLTHHPDPAHLDSKMSRHDSNNRRNSNFEIDLNLDPRFQGQEDDGIRNEDEIIDGRGSSTIGDRREPSDDNKSKCRCDASRMLVKLSQEIESILLEAHSPRSALLTIRQELLGHIRNHDCSETQCDVSTGKARHDINNMTTDDVYGLEVTTDISNVRTDPCQSVDDRVMGADKNVDLLQQKPNVFPRSEVDVHHSSNNDLSNCEDAMRRLSVCLRSDRKLLTVTRAFGDKDPMLNFENEIFNTKNIGSQKAYNSELYNSESENLKSNNQCEYVNVKSDSIVKSKCEFVNRNSKGNCDNMSELSINYELMDKDKKDLCGKETRAHREKPSIWQMYYMQSSKTQHIKDEISSKLKNQKAKHIPYFRMIQLDLKLEWI
ncbi:uncharacterized protein LOC113386238 [Ctenocephalides felis]|uniref:uncharacterized protein LOC113386238 n=1 Tax=Ctenocephalides felis TaxID=7515 RepID=UPI000E6E1292|nr:uncharacterized protein LOC113386238 [Ctenocephalides felis]